MVTGCLASIGLPLGEPPVLTIEDGRLVAATEPEGERLLAALRRRRRAGPERRRARASAPTSAPTLTGNILEDEKILGTVHVAFGASAGIGGTVSVPVHLDCLILEPTLDDRLAHRVLERGHLAAVRRIARILLLAVALLALGAAVAYAGPGGGSSGFGGGGGGGAEAAAASRAAAAPAAAAPAAARAAASRS